MTVYRYPLRSLFGDYLRSSAGLAVGIGVLLTVPPSPVIVVVFGGLTALFLAFGLRTLHRHVLRVALTRDELCGSAGGFGTRVLPWSELERLKLRYYGVRRRQQRDGGSGFMQLTLVGGGASFRVESSIDGFEHIASRAARAARENGIRLDPTSAGNLLDLGIDADAEPAPSIAIRPPPA